MLLFVVTVSEEAQMDSKLLSSPCVCVCVCVSRYDSGGQVEPRPAVIRDRRTGRYGGRHAAGRLPRGHA